MSIPPFLDSDNYSESDDLKILVLIVCAGEEKVTEQAQEIRFYCARIMQCFKEKR